MSRTLNFELKIDGFEGRLLSILLSVVLVVCSTFTVGCGGSRAGEQATAEQHVAFEAGIAAMKRREFDVAERELSKAIDNGWVSADLLEEAYLQRAQARIGLKKLDEAKSDLDWLQERATNLDSTWVARGQWYREHGSEADAAKAFQQARKINPRVVIPAKS